MASKGLAVTLEAFEATIQRSKNRLVAIPAASQRKLGLTRRTDNHLIHVSLRKRGTGRWNHHYFKLTGDNEFAVPTDITCLQAGDPIEVKVHAVILDEPLVADREQPAEVNDAPHPHESGSALLLRLMRDTPREGWRTDGSVRLDEYLREDIKASAHA